MDQESGQGAQPYKGDLLAERQEGAPSTFRQIVFHRRVLRAGWGLVLFSVLFVGCVLAETALIEHFRVIRPQRFSYMTPSDMLRPLIAFGAVIIATIVPSLFEQRHPNDYGFRGSPWKPTAAGLATGIALVSLMAGVMRFAGLLLPALRSHVPTLPYILKYGVVWFSILLLSALLEEMLVRGYLQYTLTRGLAFLYRRFLGVESGVAGAFWTAAIVLSGLFSVLYIGNPGQTNAGLACIFVMGLLYSWSLWRTGDLWWALGFHAAWDFVQAFVFAQWSGGLPVRDHIFYWVAQQPVAISGGQAGLNGSPWVYLTLAAAFASLLLLKKHTVYPELWALAEQQSTAQRNIETMPDPDRIRA